MSIVPREQLSEFRNLQLLLMFEEALGREKWVTGERVGARIRIGRI